MPQNKQSEPNDFAPKKGYSIDELRYRRAYALARYEMAKLSMMEQFEAVRSGVGSKLTGRGIAGRLLGSLNYLDWAILAFRVVGRIRKWRRRKKSD